ncbi:LLM class flavin-dependent oxidoreductase [Kibdelosporangium aridum]|nr:LLM class flavin-dependent oxidoreductase [Kibdelosporangium aridum]
MVDYGHSLSFGVSIDPTASGFPAALALARQVDHAGLDYLVVQDHPYQPGYLDAWTMMSYLLTRTERISVTASVLNLQLRPPAMLAKAAASLAAMAGGRVQLGVGGGGYPRAIASMGGKAYTGDEMVTFTDESIQLIKKALKGGAVCMDTPLHRVTGYQADPVPQSRIEVWLGSQGPKMLALTGRIADGWVCPLNIYVSPEEVPNKQAMIDAAAHTAGREPNEVRRVYNVLGNVGSASQGVGGPVELWVDTLAGWVVELGFDTFVFWPDGDPVKQLHAFADEVVPAVRARVAERRK